LLIDFNCGHHHGDGKEQVDVGDYGGADGGDKDVSGDGGRSWLLEVVAPSPSSWRMAAVFRLALDARKM
jgi:hypothetical protein